MRAASGGSHHHALIHDWNDDLAVKGLPSSIEINDETFRDGVQGTSVLNPSVEEKFELLELMQDVGVNAVSLGLPAAGPRALDEVVKLARYVRDNSLQLEPNCAARTLVGDLVPIAEAVQRTGQRIVAHVFIGSSSIRQWTEGWNLDFIINTSIEAIDFAVREGLEVAFITEDTTRSSPQALEKLFRTVLDHGASRLVLCDTVGHSTPAGARALVRWTRELTEQLGRRVKIEWHGHNDRGLALANALAAIEAGADRIHGCGLGIGERAGNTPTELLLLNLKLLGWVSHDLSRLVEYVRKVSEACQVSIPRNYPLAGHDAFRTATGVHTAALVKALSLGDGWLADRIYSAVPAGEFGRSQQIEIGPMSGMGGVRYWLNKRGLPTDEALCKEILQRAKAGASVLSEKEVGAIVESWLPPAATSASDI
jgi:2-isopropylmalate synthase